jgi:dipeptidyl aminopeptidase/acylaminoacyl peptidase
MKKSAALLVLALFTASCATTSKSKDYQGLGAESVSPELLKTYAPPSLDPKLVDNVRHMYEIASPGVGMIAPFEHALYFTWGITGVSQVWRTSGPLKFPRQVTSGTDPTYIDDITTDGKYLILSRDHAGEENPGLYLQSTKGGPLIEIQHKKGVQTSFAFVSTDASTIFYTANDISPDSYALYAYSIGSGKKELLFSQPGLWSVADVVNDNKFLMEKRTSNFIAEYFVFTLEDRKLVPILGQGEKEDYNAVFGLNSSELFVVTPKFGNFRRLYRYTKGHFTPLTNDTKRDVENVAIAHNRLLMIVQYNDGGYAKLEAYDPRTMKRIKLPSIRGAESMKVGGISRMGRYASIGVETSLAPRTSYVFDYKTGAFTQWVAPSEPEVDPSKFVASSLETYPARDGTKIPMLVWRPRECANKVCPVVVNFHGGPEGQARPGFNRAAELFVAHGFIFVEPNVRGSEGYGKDWLHSDDGPKRLQVITDIPDCADFIRKTWSRNGVAPKIGVMGGSYGGYSAQIAMTKFAGSFDAGVSIVGMSNLKTFLMNTAPYRRIVRIAEYGDPEKDAEALKQLSPITYVDQTKAPLMLIQGASDPRVPVGEAIQMHDALTSRGVEAPLIIFADEGHGAAKRDNGVIQIGAALKFFETHLQ